MSPSVISARPLLLAQQSWCELLDSKKLPATDGVEIGTLGLDPQRGNLQQPLIRLGGYRVDLSQHRIQKKRIFQIAKKPQPKSSLDATGHQVVSIESYHAAEASWRARAAEVAFG